jgi:hypothetical protein
LRAVPLFEDRLFWAGGTDLENDAARVEFDAGGGFFLDHFEQVASSPEVVAFAVQIFAGRLAFLLYDFFCGWRIQRSLEIAETRIVSRFMRSGAEIRTLPVGG